MTNGGNCVAVAMLLVLPVTPHEEEQIKNLGKVHLEKRQQGKHQIPFDYLRSSLTCRLKLRWIWDQPKKV